MTSEMTQAVDLEQGIRDSRDRIGIERKLDLGVLLVHGIGEQMRGDTLTEEGDHIIRWLRRRVSGGNVDVLDVVARQRSGDDIPTAHAVVRIRPPMGQAIHWVVAESHWADTFRPATYGELAGWGVSVGPWVYATVVAGIARRMEIGEGVSWLLRLALIPLALLAGAVMLLGAAAFGLLITALALALVLVALTRIPFLSDLARSLQRALAFGFGDAYVLTRSPVRFGAMATQVRSDLQVLLRECSNVAVVAHSQGTAVSWYALQREVRERPDDLPPGSSAPAPIGLFVTYGQAVRKLTFALKMARGAQTGTQTVAALGSAAFVGLAVLAFVAGLSLPVIGSLLVLAGIAESVLVSSARRIWKESGEEIESDWAKVKAKEPTLEWLDLWASADPAPVGPLDVKGKGITSYKIRNLSSTLLDHFVYWRNTTEFLAIVGSRLFALGGPKAYASDLTDPRLQVAAMRRHARVLMLLTMRVFVAGGVVAGLLHAWMTPRFGSGLIAWVDRLNLPLIDEFFVAPPDWAVALAGYIGVLLLGAVVWVPISWGWNGLVAGDEATYFRGIRRPLWSVASFALGALATLIATAAAALLWLADDQTLAAGYAFGSVFAALLSLTVLASGGRTFAGAEKSQSARVATRKITRSTASSFTIAIAVAAVMVAVPVAVGVLRPDALGPALAIESVALSAVLAIEGIREYRLFRARFEAQNQKLPNPAKQAGSKDR